METNAMSKDERFMNQGAVVTKNTENERIVDGVPTDEDTENERVSTVPDYAPEVPEEPEQ